MNSSKTRPMLGLLFLMLAASSSYALEPLKESTEELINQRVQSLIKAKDLNKDGKIEEKENAGGWKRQKGYDQNKDGALDAAELRAIPLNYIASSGKKLRNVLFKKTPQGGVYMDFYFPDEDTSSGKPVVIFTHGGGWAAGSKEKAGTGMFNQIHVKLLKRGFCVLSVGYRLVEKDGETKMRECVIDAQDALRFVSAHKKELGINPERIYTFGDSAGGHLAQMVLLSSPEALKGGDPELAKYSYKTVAGVSWYGPCDFQDVQLFNHDDREKFRDRFGPRIVNEGVSPEEKKKAYHEMSPVSYLTENSPKLLMIQGDKDTTIPVKQAYRMQEELKTVKAPVEIIIVKNAGHNWRSVDAPIEPSRNEIIKATVDFFTKHMDAAEE